MVGKFFTKKKYILVFGLQKVPCRLMWKHRNKYDFSSEDESSEDQEFEIFKLQNNFPAWNIDGSAYDLPPEGFTWITFAEHITGKKEADVLLATVMKNLKLGVTYG